MIATLRELANDNTVGRVSLFVAGALLLTVAVQLVLSQLASQITLLVALPILLACLALFLLFHALLRKNSPATAILFSLVLRPIGFPAFLIGALVVSCSRRLFSQSHKENR